MNKKIVIVGGGISGLTIAHELLDKGFNVILFEKDEDIGGFAKSRREENNIPSEHSWRGYAPFYKNCFNILRKIPYNSKTVYDNLSYPVDFYLLRNEKRSYKPSIKISDWITIYYYGLKMLFADKRKKDLYSKKFVPLLKNKLSKDGWDYFIKFGLGPGYGMELKDASVGHFYTPPILATIGKSMYKHEHKHNGESYAHQSDENWHVMTKPTNEAWFNPWKGQLLKKGLILHTESELVKINHNDKNIESLEILFDNGVLEKVYADEYIIACNPYNAKDIFKKSRMNKLYTKHKLITENTESNQISFRLGFNRDIKYPKNNIAFVMSDSEFNITWYPQEKHWKGVDIGDVKTLWSGTIINWYTKGRRYNKTAVELTKDQLLDEIISQIFRSKSFQKMIRDSNGHYITSDDIVYSEIWNEWKYINGKLRTDDKKWVNNVYNEKHRFDNLTEYNNLYLAGAHTKTSINIWSMEGAVESGKKVVNILCDKYNLKKSFLYTHNFNSNLNFIRYIDNFLYDIHLTSVVDLLILIIFVIIILIIRLIIKMMIKK